MKIYRTIILPVFYGCETWSLTLREERKLRVFENRVDGLGMWRVWVKRGGCIGSWWGNRKEGDHWGDLGVDVRIILGCICRSWDVGIWTGLGWPRIETGGGRL